MQELASDSSIHANGARYLMHVATNFLAEVSNFVDEGNLGCQKSVGRVLDQLSALQGGDNKGRFDQIQRTIKIAHDLDCFKILAPNHDAVGPHKITDCGSFTQELRVGD